MYLQELPISIIGFLPGLVMVINLEFLMFQTIHVIRFESGCVSKIRLF